MADRITLYVGYGRTGKSGYFENPADARELNPSRLQVPASAVRLENGDVYMLGQGPLDVYENAADFQREIDAAPHIPDWSDR